MRRSNKVVLRLLSRRTSPPTLTFMKVLSQFISPFAFDVFQFAIGGTVAKRDLVLCLS
jgi:hypothetical protein